jgi:hypothetical protein
MTRFAKQNGFLAWYETSAKNNTNIDTAFNTLVGHIIKITRTMQITPPNSNTNNNNQLNVIGDNKKQLSYNNEYQNSDEYNDNDPSNNNRPQNSASRSSGGGCC